MLVVAEVIKDMILYFEGDVRRVNHALKVYSYAKTIGELEGLTEENKFILEIGAVLHDIGIKNSEIKYNSSAGNYQEIEGPTVARDLLDKYKLDKVILERVCYLIGNHHSYTKIDNTDFQILVEADFLVNIFEDEIKKEQIKIIRQKYFKTSSGTELLNSLYKI